MEKTDLSLVPIEDIIEELKSRFDIFIVYGMSRQSTGNDSYYNTWEGGKPACIGLCELLKLDIIDTRKKDFEDEDLQNSGER